MKVPGNRLLSLYHDLKESNSTSDFPNLLANTMHKILLDKFKGVNSPWRQYCEIGDLNDFKTADRVILDEAPDLLEEPEGDEAQDSTLGDNKYQIQLSTFKRMFTVTRQAIINDDLNALNKQPARFGRAAGRTLAKKIVDKLEGDYTTYDNKRLFHDDHANKTTTALANSAGGITAVAAAITAVEDATDESGEKMGLTAKYLLVPTALKDTAMRIVEGQSFIPVTTSGGTTSVGIAKQLTVLVEPFLTSATKWYVLADPSDAPVIEVGFLNRKETPDLLVRKAEAVKIAGGDDPWGFDFDDMVFKVRHDWATQLAMYQGIYRGGS